MVRGAAVTAERRELMMETVESDDGFQSLRKLVQTFLNECIPVDLLLDDLAQIVDIVEPEHEDDVERIRDQLAKHCHPRNYLLPPEHCKEQLPTFIE